MCQSIVEERNERHLRRENSSHTANHDHVATSNGSDGRTTGIVDTPTQETTAGSKACNGIQEDRSVLGVLIGRESQDRVADDRARKDPSHEDTSLVGSVTQVAQRDGDNASHQVWWDGLELSLGRSPAELAKNRGDEGTESLDGTVGAEEAPGADVGVDVEDGSADVQPSDLLFFDLFKDC